MGILDDTSLDEENSSVSLRVVEVDDDEGIAGGFPEDDSQDDGEVVDDEFIEDDEDDIIVAKPRKKKAVVKKRTAKRRTREPADDEVGSAQSRMRNRIDVDLDEFYSGLDFGSETVSVSVERLEPKQDAEGNDIAGHIATFKEVMTKDDLKQRYGGGLFKVTIRGPKPGTGRGNCIRGSKTIRVSGKPKILGDSASNSAKPEIDAMNLLLSSKSEDMKRMASESKETKDLLMGILTKEDKTLPIFMAMMEKEKESMNPMMQQMMAQQTKDAELRREEKADQLRREERAETRRVEQMRLDAETRKEERADDQRRFEAQLEQSRQRSEADNARQAASMQMMMSFMSNSNNGESSSQNKIFEMMAASNTQALAQGQAMMQFQGNMFQAALTDAKESTKQKSGFGEAVENMAMLKEVMGGLGGGAADDTRGTAEKAIDKIIDIVPTIGATVASMMSAKSTPQLEEHQPQQQQYAPQGPMQPGVMAVVDEIETIDFDEEPQAQGQIEAQPQSETVTVDSEAPNDFMSVMLPPEDAEPNVKFSYMIKSMDYAIGAEWSSDRILHDIMLKFPADIQDTFATQTGDSIVKMIDEHVPASWVITTPKGESTLRAAHQKLVDHRNINSG